MASPIWEHIPLTRSSCFQGVPVSESPPSRALFLRPTMPKSRHAKRHHTTPHHNTEVLKNRFDETFCLLSVSICVCTRLCPSVSVSACTAGAMLALGTDQSLLEVRSVTDFREGLSDKLECGGLPSPSQGRWRFLFPSGGEGKFHHALFSQKQLSYSTPNFFGWVLCPNSMFYKQQTSAGIQKLDMSAGAPTRVGWRQMCLCGREEERGRGRRGRRVQLRSQTKLFVAMIADHIFLKTKCKKNKCVHRMSNECKTITLAIAITLEVQAKLFVAVIAGPEFEKKVTATIATAKETVHCNCIHVLKDVETCRNK